MPNDPGALPRSLDVIFNSLGDKLYEGGVQTKTYSQVMFLDEAESRAAEATKQRCLNFMNTANESHTISKMLEASTLAVDMEGEGPVL